MWARLRRLFKSKIPVRPLDGTPNFSPAEFRCRDGSDVPEKYRDATQTLMWQLEELRAHLGNPPIRVMSGYRSPKHNRKVGGAKRSKHVLGQAADIKVAGYSPAQVADAIEVLILSGRMLQGGLGRYATFTHYDIRGHRARWGKK